jgi:hypothetical protein
MVFGSVFVPQDSSARVAVHRVGLEPTAKFMITARPFPMATLIVFAYGAEQYGVEITSVRVISAIVKRAVHD